MLAHDPREVGFVATSPMVLQDLAQDDVKQKNTYPQRSQIDLHFGATIEYPRDRTVRIRLS
jgi:hypothetical protein